MEEIHKSKEMKNPAELSEKEIREGECVICKVSLMDGCFDRWMLEKERQK